LIWLKRFAPLVVLAIIALGWYLWDDHRTASELAEREHKARIMAQTWVKLARYAGDEDAFLAWRDSMLAAEGVTRADMFRWLAEYENRQEQHLVFAQRVEALVDSMTSVEDSVLKAEQADTAAGE